MDTRTLFRNSCPSGSRQLYVSGTGDDTNGTGASGSPWRTIQKAVDNCQVGDRIVVGTGTYDYFQLYGKQGSPTAWITIEEAAGANAVVDVSNSVASYDNTKLNNGCDIQQSTYVGIYGLEIRGNQTSSDTNPSGIGIFRGSHHVAVWCCDVHDFPGGGINCFYIASSTYQGQTLPAGGWDAVDVFFCKIHATSKYSPYNTSGISFYGAENLTTLIDGTYGYRAVGNVIYDVVCTVAYTPGGFTDVTDGNGISPDSLAVANNLNPNVPPYGKRGLVEGNVIAACGGRGVHIYNTKNVDVLFNTLIGNLRTNSPYINGSTEVDLQLDTADPANGVTIYGNVIAPLNTVKTIDLSAQTVTGNVILGGTDTVTTGNTNSRATGLNWFRTPPTAGSLLVTDPTGLTPATAVATAEKPTTLGYTPLGGRSTVNWAAGALEPYIFARAFR